MKTKAIVKENYFEFLNKKLKCLLSKPENYLYFILALIGTGIYWYETNLHEALEIVMLFCTSSAIVFFIIQLFFSMIYRKVEKYNLITEFCLVLIFISLSRVLYDKLYFEALKSFIIYLSIPIIIVMVINKIRNWLNR